MRLFELDDIAFLFLEAFVLADNKDIEKLESAISTKIEFMMVFHYYLVVYTCCNIIICYLCCYPHLALYNCNIIYYYLVQDMTDIDKRM